MKHTPGRVQGAGAGGAVMSRKDYEAFAAILARNASILSGTAVRRLAEQMADIFAQDNPAFDRECFYTACGVRKS